MVEVDAREERRLDVHRRRQPGPDGEAVGAGNARAVEQRVDDHGVAVGDRRLDPESPEEREFLAFGLAHLERQPARREAVELILAERAEIARALEDGDLVEAVRRIDAPVQPDPGEADILLRQGLGEDLAGSEHVRRVGEVVRLAAFDDGDVDLLLVVEAAVEELELERQVGLGPDRSPDCSKRMSRNSS